MDKLARRWYNRHRPVVKRFYRGLGRLSWPETGRVLKYKATAGGGGYYTRCLHPWWNVRAFTGGQMTFTSFTPINCNPSGTRLFLFTHTHTHTPWISLQQNQICAAISSPVIRGRRGWKLKEKERREGGRGGCEGRNEGEDVVRDVCARARRKEGWWW